MSRTHRALAMLTLLVAVATATTAVAAAAPPPGIGIEDQNNRLLRTLQAAQAERTQAAVAQARSMERNTGATAATSPAPVEDQNDRLLRTLQAARAERTQAAVALARSMERGLRPVPAVDVVAAQPTVRTGPAAPGAAVDVLATLLLGLVGGLVGDGAATAGWIVATRRRVHRAAAAA
jgi:hypothetical protein